MQRKIFLVTLVIIVIVSLALLYFLLQSKAPSPIQPVQPIVNASRPQQSQNAMQSQPQPQQPAQNATQSQPKQPTIIAKIEISGEGRVLANGTETATWNSTRPFKLVLEAVPDRGYVLDHWQVNGSEAGAQLRLNITVAGNTTITAVFRKVSFTARFLNVTGKVYTGDFQLGFNNSLSIEVAPYGVDDAGCTPYNSTHKACLLGWLQDTKPLYVRYLRADLARDTNFTQLIKFVKANYSAAIIDIWIGNTTIKTTAEPSKALLVPFDATYEAVKGWFHIKGENFGLNVKMPQWKKIKIYVNHTAMLEQGVERPALITVIVKNGPVYLDIGTFFGTLPLTVFTIDRGIVDYYANALQQCNYGEDCTHHFFYSDQGYFNYVSCYNRVWDMACRPGKVMQGPSTKLEPGDWQPGDLHIEGSGEMWIKIEIVE
jgi:hypothetical protein